MPEKELQCSIKKQLMSCTGLVENMAYFNSQELPQNKYYIFGKDGAKNLAEDMKVAFLGEIPLIQVFVKLLTLDIQPLFKKKQKIH